MPWRVGSTEVRGRTLSLGKRVAELVAVPALGDDDPELAGEAFQFTGSRIRDDRDSEAWCTSIHGSCVLQDKRAFASVEYAIDPLDGDIAGGTLDLGHGAEHLAGRRRDEITRDRLVDRHPADPRPFGLALHDERNELDDELAPGNSSHGLPTPASGEDCAQVGATATPGKFSSIISPSGSATKIWNTEISVM